MAISYKEAFDKIFDRFVELGLTSTPAGGYALRFCSSDDATACVSVSHADISAYAAVSDEVDRSTLGTFSTRISNKNRYEQAVVSSSPLRRIRTSSRTDYTFRDDARNVTCVLGDATLIYRWTYFFSALAGDFF